LAFIVIILFIFMLGCGKEDKNTKTEVTAEVVKEPQVEEEKIQENIKTVNICYDTDRGAVRWVNGTVMGYYDNAMRFEFKDYCFANQVLVEYYCENEMPYNITLICRNGCVDGHCI
jgi:hypothetical protein